MNLQKIKSLSDIYTREEDFSADLADTLDAFNVGKFEDAETEAKVGTRKADIVAVGEDGTLVVENQLGKADWDEIREKLVNMGTDIYNKIKEADL